MPAAISSRAAVLEALVTLFRDRGFEGTSIAQISAATGLGKPSLYHYFPGGKDEMARSVIGVANDWVQQNLVVPLGDHSVPARKRVDAMIAKLDAFYAGGRAACLINVFGQGVARDAAIPDLGALVRAWTAAMAGVARDAGATPKAAGERALEALVRIEGALVIARALNDRTVFARQLAAVRTMLLKP